MLEKECIQQRGFRNVELDGKVTGFQINIRLTNYRGLWLSQLRPATIIVDGETFAGQQITWTINGVTYEQAELAERGDDHWSLLDPATLTVAKEGGLASGCHEIEVRFVYSSSYIPPVADTLLGSKPHKRTLILV
ncbi:DUF6379 domain-containing protein [Cohnella sp. WQ 127256]|uniref:C-glycoside deglycosidase beta subunit domain-containing protein n=1 Tax=Cohnella sp. WQ 127256 TaxID=2938790 RepID=UPI002117E0C5|nr:DUF6379 domain-containing protein [Cohnella sp. WQ 127256]